MKQTNEEAIKKLVKNDRFYSAIGRFISSFSFLESTIKVNVAHTVKLPDEFRDQIMSHDFALLCTIAENVFSREEPQERTDELRKILSRCRKLNDHRVRIVHGWWIIGGRSGFLFHTSRQKLESVTHYNDPGQIAVLADEADEVDLALWMWLRERPGSGGLEKRSVAQRGRK
jgi:hypothetical protein